MFRFKLYPAHKGFIPLTRETYAEATQKKYPWYRHDEKNKIRHYAVCPSCDNPIQLIGIVEKAQNTEKAFGKHVPRSIPHLASYNQEDFLHCDLKGKPPAKAKKSDRKSGNNPLAAKIKELLRREFDRVILTLQEAIGFRITPGLAKSMLENYLGEAGYLYTKATLLNVPWIFGLQSDSQSLIGRKIINNDLRDAIKNNVPGAKFNDDNQLITEKAGDNDLFSVNFCFLDHEISQKADFEVESMTLSFSYSVKSQPHVFFTKQIMFDYERFNYLISIPAGSGCRDESLLNLANEMIK